MLHQVVTLEMYFITFSFYLGFCHWSLIGQHIRLLQVSMFNAVFGRHIFTVDTKLQENRIY